MRSFIEKTIEANKNHRYLNITNLSHYLCYGFELNPRQNIYKECKRLFEQDPNLKKIVYFVCAYGRTAHSSAEVLLMSGKRKDYTHFRLSGVIKRKDIIKN